MCLQPLRAIRLSGLLIGDLNFEAQSCIGLREARTSFLEKSIQLTSGYSKNTTEFRYWNMTSLTFDKHALQSDAFAKNAEAFFERRSQFLRVDLRMQWLLGRQLPAVRPFSFIRRTASSRIPLENLQYGAIDMRHLLFMLS